MDSSETGPTLGSSFFFGRITAGHCDMDEIALSPTSTTFSPLSIYVRKTNALTNNQLIENNLTGMQYENRERRCSRRDSSGSTLSNYSTKRKLSNIIPSAHQSFDNLSQLMRETQTTDGIGDFDDHFTQSLPATPLTTPLTTPGQSPQGSPKFERASRNKKMSIDEVRCSLPWYYSGFIAAHNPISEFASPLVCKSEAQQNSTTTTSDVVAQDKSSGTHSSFSVTSSPTTTTQFSNGSGKFNQKKFSFTNRDMNFLAPTSM